MSYSSGVIPVSTNLAVATPPSWRMRRHHSDPGRRLNDLVDLEVLDGGWPVSEACLGPDRHHLFAPGFGLFTRVPYLENSNLAVFADCRGVKYASSGWGVADTERLAHLGVELVGVDPRHSRTLAEGTNCQPASTVTLGP